MSPDRSLAPGEINRRRRRAPEHVQAALDEAAPLAEQNHQRLRALADALLAEGGDPHALRTLVLEALADNARVTALLARAQLGR